MVFKQLPTALDVATWRRAGGTDSWQLYIGASWYIGHHNLLGHYHPHQLSYLLIVIWRIIESQWDRVFHQIGSNWPGLGQLPFLASFSVCTWLGSIESGKTGNEIDKLFFGEIIISLYMYVWNKHAGEIVTLWWVHGRPNLLVHELIGLWSNWLCSFNCLVFFCGRRIETKWGWTEVFCLVLPGSYWGHNEWGEVCTWGCQLQTLPSASSTFLHQITQLPLLTLVLFSSCWLLALIVVFSSHENSYIKICQLFMLFISSVSFADILGITQIFNDCLILQYFLHLVIFFLVWWSILLSSNLSAASILRICYKAKISFLEWLCHCRGKVPLWPNLVQEKSEWGWWLCGGAKSWLPFFESVQEKSMTEHSLHIDWVPWYKSMDWWILQFIAWRRNAFTEQ